MKDTATVQSLFEAIFESTQDAISVVNEEGLGILINPAYTRLTGLKDEDVIGKPASVDIVEGKSMHMQVLKTKKPVRGIRMKIGKSKKEVMVNVAPILVNNELKGSVGIIHDVSEIRILTKELEDAWRMIRKLSAKYTFDDILGSSEVLQGAIEQAKRAAITPATVLLRGESGTGKELFAHAIHNASDRRENQFMRVNCAALSDSLLESELFGYEGGAFTGALKGGKRGLFEEACGGTIFLDEIGEISLSLQSKLLRVLQEKEIRRVGGTRSISVTVRIIGATNANLEQKIKDGMFREDLYYRLNVFPIFIPPLRRRRTDISILCEFLIRKLNQEYGRRIEKVENSVLEVLTNYTWPGNVRELENIIGRAVINMKFNEEVILVKHLPPLNNYQKPNSAQESVTKLSPVKTWRDLIEAFEKEILLKSLEATEGNRTLAAKNLDISIRNFYYKLEKHNID